MTKTFTLFLFIITGLMATDVWGQTSTLRSLSSINVTVKGKVINEENGSPVTDHLVYVVIDSIGVKDTLATDDNGFYSDTIPDVPGPGISIFVGTYDCYQVIHSQTVFSLPTPITVNFSICDTTSPEECQAAFIAVADTLDHNPNEFHFFDLSTGDPDLWFWDFGDGETSFVQNPVHRYSVSGTYTVCLTIVSNNKDRVSCTDSVCKNVTTRQYMNLGGLVYAGEFPINNPDPQGDTLIAYLYRSLGEEILPIDTTTFSYLGYYAFPYVLPGDYLIRVELTSNSAHYAGWFPGYFPSVVTWKEATRISITENIYNAAVFLTPVKDSLSGSGVITGSVVQGEVPGNGQPLEGQEVILFNGEDVPIGFTCSGINGLFAFQELPYGNYRLKIESAGKFSTVISLTLTDQNPVADSLLLERFDHDVTGYELLNRDDLTAGFPYPNPAGEEIHIGIRCATPRKIFIEMTAVTGRLFSREPVALSAGINAVSVSLADFPSGLGFLILRNQDGEIIKTRKVLKR